MSSLQFILKKIDKTRHYLLEEINHNDLMSEKCKKTCKYLNYVENLRLISVPVGITNSEVGIKICANTVGIKKYKSIIEKKRGRIMMK